MNALNELSKPNEPNESSTHSPRPRVLFISYDPVANRMAGPGIRYSQMAQVLAQHVDLIFAIPDHSGQWEVEEQAKAGAFHDYAIVRFNLKDWGTLQPHVANSQVVICQPDTLAAFQELAAQAAHLVFDDYDPLVSEWLSGASMGDFEWQTIGWRWRMNTLTPHYFCGDFYICASERQRDWMLGLLEAMGRLNPYNFAEDRSFRRLLDVVPTGLSSDPPRHTRDVLRTTWPSIEPNDKIVLWGGGLWPWLDPLSAIQAMALVRQQRPDVKLVFPGSRTPNSTLADMKTHLPAALQLATDLGLLDTTVFFGEWVPYEDWPNVLLESDIALTLHKESLETRLAFRSRVLDYLWADLPTVATSGDATAELIMHYEMGEVVPQADVEAIAQAMLRLLQLPRPRPGTARARVELTWENAMRPLIHFCLNPRRAPDRVGLGARVGTPMFVDQADNMTAQHNHELANLAAQHQNVLANLAAQHQNVLAQADLDVRRVTAERNFWKDLSERYANGRVMRLMSWVNSRLGK